jgi:hypothetical protein
MDTPDDDWLRDKITEAQPQLATAGQPPEPPPAAGNDPDWLRDQLGKDTQQ